MVVVMYSDVAFLGIPDGGFAFGAEYSTTIGGIGVEVGVMVGEGVLVGVEVEVGVNVGSRVAVWVGIAV